MTHPSLRHTAHRPWPLPDAPWVLAQSWRHLLFAHWRVSADVLRPLVPEALEIQEAEGSAWVGVVPFFLVIRPRFIPAIPRAMTFPEINVRTYVTHRGRPGVWFFSLDARNPLAVWGARRFFHLPYFGAKMSMSRSSMRVDYRSQRKGSARGGFEGTYGPTGPIDAARPGTLEHFLAERYCLFSTSPAGDLFRTDVHHAPWPLQPAWAELESNSMLSAAGIEVAGGPELIHYAERIDVATWWSNAA